MARPKKQTQGGKDESTETTNNTGAAGGVQLPSQPNKVDGGHGKTLPKKKQFELSDTDIEILGSSQYSEEGWAAIGRRHSVDPATRESIPNTGNRAFLALPKRWGGETPKLNGVLTTKNINAVPIHPTDVASIRANMLQRNLTLPTSTETSSEEV